MNFKIAKEEFLAKTNTLKEEFLRDFITQSGTLFIPDQGHSVPFFL